MFGGGVLEVDPFVEASHDLHLKEARLHTNSLLSYQQP